MGHWLTDRFLRYATVLTFPRLYCSRIEANFKPCASRVGFVRFVPVQFAIRLVKFYP